MRNTGKVTLNRIMSNGQLDVYYIFISMFSTRIDCIQTYGHFLYFLLNSDLTRFYFILPYLRNIYLRKYKYLKRKFENKRIANMFPYNYVGLEI